MATATDIQVRDVSLTFLPVTTRVPLKFGPETLTSVTCARVCMRLSGARGGVAEGWGETPLSVQWVWPSALTYEERHEALKRFSVILARAWKEFASSGHALEVGHAFLERELPRCLEAFNRERAGAESVPYLAALVCSSAFDIALHDAYGVLHETPVYQTYNETFMNADLARFLAPADGTNLCFAGRYPADFLVFPRPDTLP